MRTHPQEDLIGQSGLLLRSCFPSNRFSGTLDLVKMAIVLEMNYSDPVSGWSYQITPYGWAPRRYRDHRFVWCASCKFGYQICRPVQQHPRGHPPAPSAAGFHMRKLAAKPEEKRLDGSAQTDVNQTSPEINPAIETRNRVQVGRHMPKNWKVLPKSVDQYAALLQCRPADVLLGECQIGLIEAATYSN
jgi:hypothetical protein